MTIRSMASRLFAAAVLGAALVSAPVIGAPSAGAMNCPAGTVLDGRTGICWQQGQGITGLTGTGGMCLPGRIGLCLGALQNSQLPGANLPTNTSAGPNRTSWP